MAAFFQWLRHNSETYLLIDAQDKVARKLGTLRPNRPRGAAIFWRRVYVPLFHLLPAKLRTGMIKAMPGSHRKTWPSEPPLKGPAV